MFLLVAALSIPILATAAPHDAVLSPSSIAPTLIFPTVIRPTFSFPPVISPTVISPTGVYPSGIVPPPTASGLSKEFANHKKLFWGAVTDLSDYSSAVESAVLLGNFGSVTPAPAILSWSALEPKQGSFVFTALDSYVNWALAHNLVIRGGALVSYSQLPSWVTSITDSATLSAVLINHVSTIVGRYKGYIRSWDVVSEAFNEDGTFRASVFYSVLGQNLFNIALHAARVADPDAKLYISDYNLDSANAKLQAIVKFIKLLNSGGLILVDGIGSEAHLTTGGAGGIASALALAASAGVEVALTTLEVLAGASTTTAQAADYVNLTVACLNQTSCVSITSAGVCDGMDAWRPTTSNGLLFDVNCHPKPAYTALINLL